MSIPSLPQPWRVADATFVEVELRNPSDRQMHVEFSCGLRLVITDASQVPVAALLIETLRAGKEVSK